MCAPADHWYDKDAPVKRPSKAHVPDFNFSFDDNPEAVYGPGEDED